MSRDRASRSGAGGFLPCDRFETGIWRPLVDVCKTPEGWLVKVELSGVKREDIRLSAEGNCLKIEGSRRDWMASSGYTYQMMEIAYRRFERCLELPCEIEKTQIVCEYRDGLFLIWLNQQRGQE